MSETHESTGQKPFGVKSSITVGFLTFQLYGIIRYRFSNTTSQEKSAITIHPRIFTDKTLSDFLAVFTLFE